MWESLWSDNHTSANICCKSNLAEFDVVFFNKFGERIDHWSAGLLIHSETGASHKARWIANIAEYECFHLMSDNFARPLKGNNLPLIHGSYKELCRCYAEGIIAWGSFAVFDQSWRIDVHAPTQVAQDDEVVSTPVNEEHHWTISGTETRFIGYKVSHCRRGTSWSLRTSMRIDWTSMIAAIACKVFQRKTEAAE